MSETTLVDATGMSREDVKKKVIDVVVEQLGVHESQINEGSKFIDDLGADSLDSVELIMGLETDFGIMIPEEDASEIVTVGNAIDYVYKTLNSKKK